MPQSQARQRPPGLPAVAVYDCISVPDFLNPNLQALLSHHFCGRFPTQLALSFLSILIGFPLNLTYIWYVHTDIHLVCPHPNWQAHMGGCIWMLLIDIEQCRSLRTTFSSDACTRVVWFFTLRIITIRRLPGRFPRPSELRISV